MRKTRFFILLTLVILFLFVSMIQPTPGNSVYACSGYSMTTGWCCDCDPNSPAYDPDCSCGGTRAVSQPPTKDSNLGTESLIVLASLLLWLRLKAN